MNDKKESPGENHSQSSSQYICLKSVFQNEKNLICDTENLYFETLNKTLILETTANSEMGNNHLLS